MEMNITKIDEKADQIRTKLEKMESESTDEYDQYQTLSTELDELTTRRNQIEQNYLVQIEEAISHLTEQDLEGIMTTYGLSLEQAHDYVYNQIMSANGNNLEAYFQGMRLAVDNGITKENLADYQRSAKELSRIKSMIQTIVEEIKQTNKDKLAKHAELSQDIDARNQEIEKIKGALHAAGYMIDKVSDEELSKLVIDLMELGVTYDQLDDAETDLTVQLLGLRKEKGLKKLFHKDLRKQLGEQSRKNLRELDGMRNKMNSIRDRITATSTSAWEDLTDEEKRAFTTYTTLSELQDPEKIKAYLHQAIVTGKHNMLDFYQAELQTLLSQHEHERDQVVETRKPLNQIKRTVEELTTSPEYYLEVLNLDPKDQETYYSLINRYPFLASLSAEELQVVSSTELTAETLILKPAKSKTKIKER